MLIKDYPFTSINGGKARPMLWIRLVNPTTRLSLIVAALIDTTADACAFPTSAARCLGYNFMGVPPRKIRTNGTEMLAYQDLSHMEILALDSNGQPKPKGAYKIDETLIDFIEGIEGFFLGRRTFSYR